MVGNLKLFVIHILLQRKFGICFDVTIYFNYYFLSLYISSGGCRSNSTGVHNQRVAYVTKEPVKLKERFTKT